jgi:predicted dehydrogenase
VAYCDLRDDRLKRLADAYGPAPTYKRFREFLKHPEMDAVAVFTPAPLHVWMATESMKVGKHVISAVPAGMWSKNWGTCSTRSRRLVLST